ncbi:hypothetical protein IFM89_019583 [Coptis chinensis]|uniref:Jacalin-type lectin domain-containing protein n=1 Tax=Coptis chinensis TaxID=261450 RepID=A0A835M8I5_9MAGN|nr:hypothetical protein IFM89_019583 [Coptis chinensis]
MLGGHEGQLLTLENYNGGDIVHTRWNWDDGAFSTIKQILLQVTDREIGSIQIEYCGKNGESIVSKWHGDFDHVIDKIELDYPDEFLTRMTGFHSFRDDISDHNVRSLCFYSNRRMYGPFGYEEGTYFDSGTYGKIVGFHGCETHLLDAIGLYVEN